MKPLSSKFINESFKFDTSTIKNYEDTLYDLVDEITEVTNEKHETLCDALRLLLGAAKELSHQHQLEDELESLVKETF